MGQNRRFKPDIPGPNTCGRSVTGPGTVRDGHLFITVLAYQMIEVIRQRLRARCERASWTTLRGIRAGQSRVTAAFRRADGRIAHVRKATRAEPSQLRICDALGLDPAPGRTKTMLA